jgi:RimJ/RimL family protein N-acetyltransferase
MWADPQVTRYIGGRPSLEEEAWKRLLGYIGHWTLMGFGYWLLLERSTGNFVGEVGFANYRRDLDWSMKGAPEIGWAVAPQYHGRGYATEAVRAVTRWGDGYFGETSTWCIISPDNTASLRVAVKCEYRKETEVSYCGQRSLIFIREPRV